MKNCRNPIIGATTNDANIAVTAVYVPYDNFFASGAVMNILMSQGTTITTTARAHHL